MDARAAESQSIIQRAVAPIVYTQRHFEASDYNITQYAKDIINKNTRHGRQLDYWDMAVAWAFKVREVYSGDAAKCEDLIEQIYSPLSNEFWDKRVNQARIRDIEAQDRQTRSFLPVKRAIYEGKKLSAKDILMERKTDGLQLLVPDVMLRTLNNISYKGFARSVLEMNSETGVPIHVMRSLWTAVVQRVFHFECELVRGRKMNQIDDLTPDQFRDLVEQVSKPPTTEGSSKRKAGYGSTYTVGDSKDTGDESESPRPQDKKPRKSRSHRPTRGHSLYPKKGKKASKTTTAPVPPARQAPSPVDTPASPPAAQISRAAPSGAPIRELHTHPDSGNPASDGGEESAPNQQSQMSRPRVGGLRMIQTKRSSERLRGMGGRREEK